MITETNTNNWYVLRTTPKTERKLMRHLNAAGYTVFCPMQILFKKWNGLTKEVFAPLFPGYIFIEASGDIVSYASSHNITFLMDNTDKILSICADKMELSAKFAQLFK